MASLLNEKERGEEREEWKALLNNKKGLKDRAKYIIVQLLLFITKKDPDRPSSQVLSLIGVTDSNSWLFKNLPSYRERAGYLNE
jgi:hypothetical protein